MIGRLYKVAERAAAAVMKRYREGGGEAVVRRGDVDVTRLADQEAEEAALSALREEFPEGAYVVSEESGVARWGDERYLILVDPLDGSENFFAKVPLFAVAVAGGVYRKGTLEDVKEAVLYLPATGDVYAVDGGEVRLNGASLSPVQSPRGVALVELGAKFPREHVEIPQALGLKIRSLGCATYSAFLAALGYVDLFIDLRRRLGPWDVAPALAAGLHNPAFQAWLADGYALDRRVAVIAGKKPQVQEAVKLAQT